MHGIPADRVVLTGAQRFDDWFERRPSTTREEFQRKVGLDPAEPYVLYLCSSPFIAPDEVGFVRRWLAAVRAQFPEVGVLVRPHPQNGAQWEGVDLGDPNAVVWPPGRPAARRRRGARGVLRLARPQRLHRRHQHQRPDRGRDRRQGRAHSHRRRFRRHAGGHAALPVPALGERRAAPRRARPRRARAAARASARAGRGGRPPGRRASSSGSRARSGSTSPRRRSSRRGSRSSAASAPPTARIPQPARSRRRAALYPVALTMTGVSYVARRRAAWARKMRAGRRSRA